MQQQPQSIALRIPVSTIVKVIAALLLLAVLYEVRGVLALLFIAIILASAFDPTIDKLEHYGVPRALGMVMLYGSFFGFAALLVALLIGPISEQVSGLLTVLPDYLNTLGSYFGTHTGNISFAQLQDVARSYFHTIESSLLNADTARGALGGLGAVFSALGAAVGSIISFILVLVMTFYLVVQETAVKRFLLSVTPDGYQPYVAHLMNELQRKMGLWLRGQLILSTIIGLLVGVTLSLFGIKYALLIGILAGLLEFIPYLGPILAGIIAVFLSLGQGGWSPVIVLVIFMVVQWLENNLIVPKVMQHAVGLNPIVSIAVLLMGFQLGGVVGGLLAIPVATGLNVLISDLIAARKSGEEK